MCGIALSGEVLLHRNSTGPHNQIKGKEGNHLVITEIGLGITRPRRLRRGR